MSRNPCEANPIFYGWIRELKAEATTKGQRNKAHNYTKALSALKQYPLPLRSGEEAKIIKNVGDKIADILDKKCREFYSEKGFTPEEVKYHMTDIPLQDLASVIRITTTRKRKRKSKEKHSDIISKMDEILQTGATVEKCAKKQLKPPPQCTINRTASVIQRKTTAKVIDISDSESDNELDAWDFKPGDYSIILCVDNAEISSNKNSQLLKQLNKSGISYEVRKLQVGDFLWIARQRATCRELVLDYIIERKRMDDLASSIVGDRFREQKLRLRRCGISNVIYLVETKSNYLSLPDTSINQAIVNTKITDGFKIKRTDDLKDTAGYLILLTQFLLSQYHDKRLKSIENPKNTSLTRLLKYSTFSQNSTKSRVFSVKETFVKQLARIPKVSHDKAIAIANVFETPRKLLETIHTLTEPHNIVADIKFGANSKKIGVAVSRTVAMFYKSNIALT